MYVNIDTVGANNASKLFFAVGKVGDEGMWKATSLDLDKKGFVNQHGLSRKVDIPISSYMRLLVMSRYSISLIR